MSSCQTDSKRHSKKPRLDYPTIELLPEEVLMEIFQYLSIKDRKNIRLQCHKLYEVCIQKRISKKEKFVISPCYSIDEISKTIFHCKYSILNLDFHSYPLNKLPTTLLKYNGEKIIRLCLFECDLSNEILSSIVTYCINLQHWELWMTSNDNSIEKTQYAHKMFGYCCHLFNDCTRNGVIRENLVTLKIITQNCSVNAPWDCILKKCLLVFPNMKSLMLPCFRHDLKLIGSSSHSIVDIINSSKLETIPFIGDTEMDHTTNWITPVLAHVTKSKFKQIHLRIFRPDRELQLLYDFFRNQEKLEVINLMVPGISFKQFTELVFHILQECPNLRRLHFSVETDPYFTVYHNEQKVLANFHLKYLCSTSSLFQHVKVQSSSLRTLDTLVLNDEWPIFSSHYVSLFVSCSNLKHLETPVTNEILNAIIKHLPGLLSLKIRCSFCMNSSLKKLRKLSNLRCLRITDINNIKKFFEKHKEIAEALIFPKLKHLSIDFEFRKSWCDPKCLISIACNNPQLEIICFKSYRGPFKFIAKFSESLKNLHYFHCPIIYSPKNVQSLCEGLFYLSRSLRFMRYSNSGIGTGRTLCFNPISQKVVLMKRDFYDPFEPFNEWDWRSRLLSGTGDFHLTRNRCPYEGDNIAGEV